MEPPKPTDRTLARTIRAARAYAGITRPELAKRLGMSPETIGRYERGEWRELPKRPVIESIARACGVPEEWMFVGWPDAATRFADQARDEARRTREHPPSDEADQAGEG